MEKLPAAKIKLHSAACDGHLFIRGPRHPISLRSIISDNRGLVPTSNSVISFPSGLHGERDLIRAEMLTR